MGSNKLNNTCALILILQEGSSAQPHVQIILHDHLSSNGKDNFVNQHSYRCAHAAVHFNGRIYAIGGKSLYPTGPTLAKVESYSLVDEEWYSEADMPVPLYHHNATVYNGNIYVVGWSIHIYFQNILVVYHHIKISN